MIHKQCTYNLIICILINLFLLVSFNSYFFCKIYMLYINICCPHRDGPFYFWGGASKRGRLTIFFIPAALAPQIFFLRSDLCTNFSFFHGASHNYFFHRNNHEYKEKKKKNLSSQFFFLNILAHNFFSKMRLAHNFFFPKRFCSHFFFPEIFQAPPQK